MWWFLIFCTVIVTIFLNIFIIIILITIIVVVIIILIFLLLIRVVLVTINNILLYKKLGSIIFDNLRLLNIKIFFNFDFLINFKPKPRPLSPMAQKNYFLT